MSSLSARAAGLLLATIALAGPARAEDAAFVGTWSLDPANCGAGAGERERAVGHRQGTATTSTRATARSKSIEGGGGEWKLASECTAEGSATPYDFSLTVSGDTLTFTDSGGPRDFLRCK
ncbi:MAG: hypothetical protein WDN31_04625 [Hyphomicrobium sp.]